MHVREGAKGVGLSANANNKSHSVTKKVTSGLKSALPWIFHNPASLD